jgi:uncharacterized delta-60 repeat protein
MRNGSHLWRVASTEPKPGSFVDGKVSRDVAGPVRGSFFRRALVAAVLVLGLLTIGGTASAAPGNLDLTFGKDGKITTDFSGGYDEAQALAVQPDGKLVAAGRSDSGSGYDFALARYNKDGSLDAGFGQGRKSTTSFGGSYDDAYALALQPDGRLVAAGSSGSDSGTATTSPWLATMYATPRQASLQSTRRVKVGTTAGREEATRGE